MSHKSTRRFDADGAPDKASAQVTHRKICKDGLLNRGSERPGGRSATSSNWGRVVKAAYY